MHNENDVALCEGVWNEKVIQKVVRGQSPECTGWKPCLLIINYNKCVSTKVTIKETGECSSDTGGVSGQYNTQETSCTSKGLNTNISQCVCT